MSILKQKIKKDSDSTTSCLVLAQEVDKVAKDSKKVAILSSFTIKGLAECLKVKSFNYEIFLDVYVGEYSQWKQEILGEKLYKHKPDIIFLMLDQYGLDQDIIFKYYGMPPKDLNKILAETENELSQLISKLKEKTKAKIIISNACKIWPPVMGIFDSKLEQGWYEIISNFNKKLIDEYKQDKQIFIFNFNDWLGHIGKKEFWHDKYFFMADMKLSPNAFPMLAEEWMSYIIALAGKKKKCLVLDLDNTLWGGIIGEDGLAGIKLAPNGAGQEYYYFQKLLKGLSKAGILLTINSKNNKKDVEEVFKKHPHMVLKDSDFVAKRINWENKATNIQSLAKDINIGMDSMVFIDDDMANRELVKETLPEVTVLDLPNDSTKYIRTLLDYKGFNTFEFTREDTKRSKMYLDERKRREFKETVVDMDSFLKSLEICITVQEVNDFLIPRSAQLTQKTNQFNLTTYRYQEEDIKKFMEEGHKLYALDTADKFGEYGITGFCIAKDLDDLWEIDTMLLSCRILGKKIEEQFFNYILNELKKIKPKLVRAKYIPTAKNEQTKNFYKLFNFKKVGSIKCEDTWELDLTSFKFKPLDFIKIKAK